MLFLPVKNKFLIKIIGFKIVLTIPTLKIHNYKAVPKRLLNDFLRHFSDINKQCKLEVFDTVKSHIKMAHFHGRYYEIKFDLNTVHLSKTTQ